MTTKICPSCKTEFQFLSYLIRHINRNVRCAGKINDIDKLIYDFKNISTINSKFICSKCNSNFTQKSSLKTHIENSKCSRNKISDNTDNTITITTTTETNNTTTIITNTTNTTEIINNDTINNDITSFKYIYLIEKFDVNNKEYIYKFGKTNREYSKRIKDHGYEANVLLILDVNNCNVMEKKILNILSNTENIRKCDFGNEYFLCNDKEYIKSIILKNIYN